MLLVLRLDEPVDDVEREPELVLDFELDLELLVRPDDVEEDPVDEDVVESDPESLPPAVDSPGTSPRFRAVSGSKSSEWMSFRFPRFPYRSTKSACPSVS